MTSAVKGATRDLEEAFRHCESYLAREIEAMEPSVVVTTGSKPTRWTARLLGVSPGETRRSKISRPAWWGRSDFDTDPPMIHVPHWGYSNTHHRLSEEEWDEVIRVTCEALESTYFG